jgi:hypothetical protein
MRGVHACSAHFRGPGGGDGCRGGGPRGSGRSGGHDDRDGCGRGRVGRERHPAAARPRGRAQVGESERDGRGHEPPRAAGTRNEPHGYLAGIAPGVHLRLRGRQGSAHATPRGAGASAQERIEIRSWARKLRIAGQGSGRFDEAGRFSAAIARGRLARRGAATGTALRRGVARAGRRHGASVRRCLRRGLGVQRCHGRALAGRRCGVASGRMRRFAVPRQGLGSPCHGRGSVRRATAGARCCIQRRAPSGLFRTPSNGPERVSDFCGVLGSTGDPLCPPKILEAASGSSPARNTESSRVTRH